MILRFVCSAILLSFSLKASTYDRAITALLALSVVLVARLVAVAVVIEDGWVGTIIDLQRFSEIIRELVGNTGVI